MVQNKQSQKGPIKKVQPTKAQSTKVQPKKKLSQKLKEQMDIEQSKVVNKKPQKDVAVIEEQPEVEPQVSLEELNRLKSLVKYDELTGLYNMRTFLKKGAKLIKDDRNWGIIVFSADNFDKLSGLYGIQECDKIRKHIGTALKGVLQDEYLYGRVYENLFAIMLSYNYDTVLIDMVNNITSKITQYGEDSKLDLSFGICEMRLADNIEDAIIKAELVKRTVNESELRLNYTFFTEDIRTRMEEDIVIGKEMENALKKHQFHLFLQPIVNVRTHEIVRAEGLVRWLHPKKGVLTPFQFLPLFEANNFIIKMDHYIWNEACKTIRHWIDNKVEPIPIHLNISPIHFEHAKFVDMLVSMTTRNKISPEYICLEIPEKVFSEPTDKNERVLMKLKGKGFPLCIDNFGSVHSPIGFMMNSPVSLIKMDRNFLRENMYTDKGMTFIRYLYSMATEFNMEVVAEGIEDMEQVLELTDIGGEYAQGFFFSKPVDLREFDRIRMDNIKNQYIPKVMYPTFEFEDRQLLP